MRVTVVSGNVVRGGHCDEESSLCRGYFGERSALWLGQGTVVRGGHWEEGAVVSGEHCAKSTMVRGKYCAVTTNVKEQW